MAVLCLVIMDKQNNVVMVDVLSVISHEATTLITSSPIPEYTLLVFVDEFAKFSQYQEALNNSSPFLSSLVETGKPNTSSFLFLKVGH